MKLMKRKRNKKQRSTIILLTLLWIWWSIRSPWVWLKWSIFLPEFQVWKVTSDENSVFTDQKNLMVKGQFTLWNLDHGIRIFNKNYKGDFSRHGIETHRGVKFRDPKSEMWTYFNRWNRRIERKAIISK